MQEVYLDNAATTRCSPAAAALAAELMTEEYGNPSSLHAKGFAASRRLETARAALADTLGCEAREVIFTSGGTEANNLALFGAAKARRRKGNTAVVTATAHASMLAPMKELEAQGLTVKRVNPRPDGTPDTDALIGAAQADTILFACEMVCSETGAVMPVEALCRALRRKAPDAHIHLDAVQGFGKLELSARRFGVDSLTVSGHKLHGPKGTGALYLRHGARILPIMRGGDHESGLRPGTEGVPLICAFALAAEQFVKRRGEYYAHVRSLRDIFMENAEKMEGVCINSPPEAAPYISNISVPGYKSETLLHYLAQNGVYVSSGSACSKGAPSHVLTAMGLPRARIDSALRVSLCPHNTAEDIGRFFEHLSGAMRAVARAG